MAQYFTDFGDQTAGGSPSGWTPRWVTSGVTWSIQSDAGATGGKLLRGVRSSVGRSMISWDTIDADVDRDDVEVLTRLRIDSQPNSSSTYSGVVGRGSGSSSSESGYVGELQLDGGAGYDLIAEYVSGSFATLANAAQAWSVDTWYWLRLRINSTNLKLRRWSGAVGDEPASWGVEVTDTSISAAGWVGAFMFMSTTTEWDVMGVGTAGDTAPSSEPSAAAAFPFQIYYQQQGASL